ncbi:MAG: rod shape-determining protein MreD [Bacteroidetes bacterium]|nr:rod shape-determining protein MreD [Bacteroidota bacterium]
MARSLLLPAISLLILLVQTIVVPFAAVGTIIPDLILIWVVFLGITRGPVTASSAGFFLGLLADVLAGDDGMLGLSSLTKTIAGFLAGYTFNENKTTQTLTTAQFPLIVAVVGLMHNLLYFIIFLQGTDISWEDAIVRHGLPATVYTALVTLLPMFVFARHYRT